jgi:hypothetical protein
MYMPSHADSSPAAHCLSQENAGVVLPIPDAADFDMLFRLRCG